MPSEYDGLEDEDEFKEELSEELQELIDNPEETAALLESLNLHHSALSDPQFDPALMDPQQTFDLAFVATACENLLRTFRTLGYEPLPGPDDE
jgi:hypothetical protein